MPSEPNYHTQLRDLLLEHFSLPELQNLAFELGIKPDDVSEPKLSIYARELVSRQGREGKLHKLVALCRQKRPDVFWPNPPDEPTAPQPPIYGLLPPPVPHFVGRQDEIAWLQTQVRPGRVVVLCAAGGMGKTTVAVRGIVNRGEGTVSSEQWTVNSGQWTVNRGESPISNLQSPFPIPHSPLTPRSSLFSLPSLFPDGILFYTFYGRPSVQAAMEQMCQWLGADPRPDAAGVLQGLLGRRRLLLLLDGAEACDDLEAVLAVRGGGCGVLVTTRDREQLWGCDAHWELEPLPDAEAVQLLQAVGGQWAADEAAVKQICQLVGSLPLAVQLVGNYLAVRQQQAAEYLDWLRRSPLQALHWRERRDKSVAYLLGHSLPAVGEAGQAVLSAVGAMALAPFPATVAQVSNLQYEGLEALGRYGLVVRRGEWYEVSHALVYTYAHEQLPATPPVVAGLAEWLSQQAEEQNQRGLPGYQQLDPLRPHVLACLAACATQQQWAAANQLVWAVQNYLDIRGYATERRTVLELGIQAAKALGNKYDESAHSTHIGLAYAALGQVTMAIRYYEQALAIDKETGDKRGEGADLGNLGLAYSDLGQVETAVSFYQQALTIARDIGDKRNEGVWLGNLGIAYRVLGQVETAVSYHQQALTIAREIGDKRGEGADLGNLGLAYSALGQVETAKDHYQQALEIAQQIGDRYRVVLWSWYWGRLVEKDDPQQAIELMSPLVAYEREIGHRDAEKYAQEVEKIRGRLSS